MLMRISEKFRRHYRPNAVEREIPPRPFPLTWNIDLLPWNRSQIIVLASEEYSLFSLLMGLSRKRSVETFQDAFRERVRQFLDNIRWWQLPYLPMFTFSRRQNRSIISSQNDLLHLTDAFLETASNPVSEAELRQVEEKINVAPMSYLGMDSPKLALQKLIQRQWR
jgi:uncharacterized protein DUF6933